MEIKKTLLSLAVIVFAGLFLVTISGCGDDDTPAVTTTNGAAESEYVNTLCPIMGSEIDFDKVTDDLVREHRGQRVAFCCAGCPEQWDALSDEEKDSHLADAK